ncbi:uncharacterized protein LOC110736145 [Chenopodium quinoa]|uniref:uncharacterized protein LOC110736145 n=1 Tax=Chenopodium quinoa TaxID=63459 RepID=UPI000B7986B9|nr:uncharacterized protein LOC110736145 [Chenopodium quinoa]
MGRGRGKGKKLTVTSHDDPGSGEEEKIPAQKRRGRPQKPLKDEVDDEDVVGKVEEEDSENKDSSITTAIESGKKRKRSSPSKEKQSPVKEENSVGATLVSEISTKPSGFRHIGSRRKNKPRRAAEVGVEC